MSPRPQKVTDDDIFMAAQRAMSRLGPGELTLADIANEAGVTAGLLVQRFGSKRDLLLALSRALFRRHRRDVRGAAPRPSLAAGDAAGLQRLHGAAWPSSPAAFARNFAYLQIDLTDPDFRKHLAKHAAATRVELQKLIKEAIDAEELSPDTNRKQLARTIEAVVGGSMMSWAFYQKGTGRQVDASGPRRGPETLPG